MHGLPSDYDRGAIAVETALWIFVKGMYNYFECGFDGRAAQAPRP